MVERRRLLAVLQYLIHRTQNLQQLGALLAREVIALKMVVRRAREEGGLDSVVSVVCLLEPQIMV